MMKTMKQRITEYWEERAEGFEEQRKREFASDKKARWKKEIQRYLPQGDCLRVLDIGTGTGFFACLLGEDGHKVTGIDLSPKMIEHAVHMSKQLGIPADFRVMDAEKTEFESDAFDVIVTRNLTWTLTNPGGAYREWHRILKPEGVLINFDADYYRELDRKDSAELPPEHAHMRLSEKMMKENDEITRMIGKTQKPRPDWDIELLRDAGFHGITADLNVYQRIYIEADEFYNPSPVFVISAVR